MGRGIMIRWIPAAAIATFVLGAPAAYAQTPAKEARSSRSAFPAGSIEGRVLTDSNNPVAGAMVSVVGRTTAAATTDRDGRYTLRDLPYGPYILSVHSRGYFKSRGRTVQLTTSKISIPEIQLQLASARKVPVAAAEPVATATPVQATQLAGFGLDASQPAKVADDSGRRTAGASGVRGRDRARRNRVAPAALAAQHSQGRGGRRGVGGRRQTGTRDGSAAIRPRRLCRSRSSATFRCPDSST